MIERRAWGVAPWVIASGAWGQALPVDPAWATGRLDNGMAYMVLEHANPPERVGVWLHIDTGSLNEQDEQRGVAHFLEHLAFNGTEHFPPGEALKFFERMGMRFGADLNAHTGFDQTVYKLRLPDATPGTLGEGLRFLSDVAFRMSLIPEEIERERKVILEEKRSGSGAQQRVLDQVFVSLSPGSRFGERLPIGTEATILGADRDQFVRYYEGWYTPDRMTLIVVGDLPTEAAVERIEAEMDVASTRAVGRDLASGVRPSEAARALVISDRELTRAEVSIIRVDAPEAPALDEPAARARLVESIAWSAFNRRLDARVQKGEASFLSASLSMDNAFGAMRLLWGQASGEPEAWSGMLGELVGEVQRARAHGFSAREIDDVRREIVASAEWSVQVDPTLDAWAILTRTSSRIAEGEPNVSASQRLELTTRQIAGVSVEEVNEAFARLADPTNALFLVTLPSSAPVPSEADVLSRAREAMLDVPPALEDSARPTSFMDQAPTPGEIVASEVHDASGVVSAWLSNGVRVHYRYMDYEKDEATCVISLAGGEIEEDASTRGLSQAAAQAWGRPATDRLSSTDVRDLLTGLKVGVQGGSGQDVMSLTISGSPSDFEPGMQLAHLLLTAPRLEEAGFTQWKERVRQGIAARDKDPRYALGPALYDAILPEGEARVRELTGERLDAITLEDAQRWLDVRLARAPIEVVLVGDMGEARAMDLLRTYVGSLPARERVSGRTLAERRTIAPPPGARTLTREIRTETPMAFVVAGFFAADVRNTADDRRMFVAAQVLTPRLVKALREEEQLVYSISAGSSSGVAYPALGTLSSFAPTDPDKAETLVARLHEMYARFAREGPTQEEMEIVRRQIRTQHEERILRPGTWVGTLGRIDYRGLAIEALTGTADAVDAMTAEEIRETFDRYHDESRTISVIVRPEARSDDPPK